MSLLSVTSKMTPGSCASLPPWEANLGLGKGPPALDGVHEGGTSVCGSVQGASHCQQGGCAAKAPSLHEGPPHLQRLTGCLPEGLWLFVPRRLRGVWIVHPTFHVSIDIDHGWGTHVHRPRYPGLLPERLWFLVTVQLRAVRTEGTVMDPRWCLHLLESGNALLP